MEPFKMKKVSTMGPNGLPRYEYLVDDTPAAGVGPAVAPKVAAPVAPAAPAPLKVTAPVAPAVLAPAWNIQRNVGGLEGISRIEDYDQPGAPPLFTNIADTAQATRGIFTKPGVSPESLEHTLATSSVFNTPNRVDLARQAIAAGGDPDEVVRRFRTPAENAEADELDSPGSIARAQGAIGRGITNSLRNGVPAKLFPDLVQSVAGLQVANAKGGLDAGDLAALTNAATSQGQLEVALARLKQDGVIAADKGRQAQTGAQARSEGDALTTIAKFSVNPQTGLFDPAQYDLNLVKYGPVFGLGADTAAAAAAPTALDVASDTAGQMRKTGKYTEAQIQQYLAQRAGK